MKDLAKVLMRLYPKQWRTRYGEEFEALIEDTSPGSRATLDLLKEAIRMQMHVPAFPKLAVILSATGLAVGFALSWLITPVYISTAEMKMSPAFRGAPDVGPDLAQRVLQIEQQALNPTNLSMIIQDPRLELYTSERAHMPIEDVVDRMRRDIWIQMMPRANENVRFRIRFGYRDPDKARATVQALVDRFVNTNLQREVRVDTGWQRERSYGEVSRLEARVAELEKRPGIASPAPLLPSQLGSGRAGETLALLDPPTLPTRPAKPNRVFSAGLGFGVGFAAAFITVLFRRRPPAIPFPA